MALLILTRKNPKKKSNLQASKSLIKKWGGSKQLDQIRLWLPISEMKNKYSK